MARDCTQRRGGPPGQFGGPQQQAPAATQFDSEYASLMAELGEETTAPPAAALGGAPGQPGPPGMDFNNQGPPPQALDEKGNKIPPWRVASNWNPPVIIRNNPPPPQARPPPPPPAVPYGGQQMSNGYTSFPTANYSAAQCESQSSPPSEGETVKLIRVFPSLMGKQTEDTNHLNNNNNKRVTKATEVLAPTNHLLHPY